MNGIFNFLIKFLFSLGFAYLSYYLFERIMKGTGVIGVLISAGFWVRLFSHEIIEFVLLFKHWGEKSAVFHWHGKYYSFDGRQIRFFLVEERVWIPLKDLKKIMEPAIAKWELETLADEFGDIPETNLEGVTEAGLLKLLEIRTGDRRASYAMIRFKRWLLHSALANVRKLPRSAVNHQ